MSCACAEQAQKNKEIRIVRKRSILPIDEGLLMKFFIEEVLTSEEASLYFDVNKQQSPYLSKHFFRINIDWGTSEKT